MAIELLAALIDLEPNAILSYEATDIELEADVPQTIPGGNFNPSLTSRPINIFVLDSDGNQISINAPTAELNGSVYDVTLYSSDSITVKVIALCTRV